MRVSAGQRVAGASAYGDADAEGKLMLRLPPGEYDILADPTEGGAACIRTQTTLHVADRPAEQSLVVRVKPACVLILEAVDAATGKGIPGVDFLREEEPADQIRGPRMVQSRSGYVDYPRTDATGRLRAVVEPGKWVYMVGHIPGSAGYRRPSLQRRVELPAGGTVTLRFELQG